MKTLNNLRFIYNVFATLYFTTFKEVESRNTLKTLIDDLPNHSTPIQALQCKVYGLSLPEVYKIILGRDMPVKVLMNMRGVYKSYR